MRYGCAAGNSETHLIPRTALVRNPGARPGRLSPDGRYMSFLAPKNGVLNVWLAPFGKLDAPKAITETRSVAIRQHHWADEW